MALDWTGAATRAQDIAANWQRATGPGGAVVLFDRDGVREAFAGGLASIEYGVDEAFLAALGQRSDQRRQCCRARGRWCRCCPGGRAGGSGRPGRCTRGGR